MSTTPAKSTFRVFRAGELRDFMLSYFASGLRRRVNPETGVLFTEDEIAAVVAKGSRWWIEADAIDHIMQGEQYRALYLADQLQVDRACTAWLEHYHGPMWTPEGRLKATRADGKVLVTGNDGTRILGSTNVPDTTVYWCRDELGHRFQACGVSRIPPTGSITIALKAMDPGEAGNIPDKTKLTWANRAPGMSPQATVVGNFTGGTNKETDAEWVARIMAIMRGRPAGGNPAQIRMWARGKSNAVEDAFVYPCMQKANSFIVAVTGKRAGGVGPLARKASSEVIQTVKRYLVPPGSPVIPQWVYGVVTGWQPDPVNLSIRLTMPKASKSGWKERVPWPTYGDTSVFPVVREIAGASSFTVYSPEDSAVPSITPSTLLVWSVATSSFAQLSVSSIRTTEEPHVFKVELTTTVPDTVVLGAVVSPACANYEAITSAVQNYFDERGPGELWAVNPEVDRCIRQPFVDDERPCRVGSEVGMRVIEALGGTSSNATVQYISKTMPSYPTNIIDGPFMLTLGKLGVYPL